MKTFADHRGIALIFEDKTDLDYAIVRLQEMRNLKSELKTPYPAVYTFVSQRMTDAEARDFHDEVWFMHYTTASTPRAEREQAPRGDN